MCSAKLFGRISLHYALRPIYGLLFDLKKFHFFFQPQIRRPTNRINKISECSVVIVFIAIVRKLWKTVNFIYCHTNDDDDVDAKLIEDQNCVWTADYAVMMINYEVISKQTRKLYACTAHWRFVTISTSSNRNGNKNEVETIATP